MALAVTYPWASASSFVTTAGDATPYGRTSLIGLAAATGIGRLLLSISLRSPSPILAATFMPPRGRLTLVVLPPVASSSGACVALSSAGDRVFPGIHTIFRPNP